MTSPSARVVVITKPGCHLCDVAKLIVEAVCDDLDVEWCAVELADLDPVAQSHWRDQVPVISVDGRVVDIYRTSADRLRAAIAAR